MFKYLLLLSACLVSRILAVDIDQEGLPETGLDTSSWVDGQLPPLEDVWSLNDFQLIAKNVLSLRDYTYYRTASLNEITYQANLNIWDDLRLNGFSFRDVSNIDMSTTILGHTFSQPFFIAPAAKAGKGHEDAELNFVKAAGEAGIMYSPSISATLEIEEIAAAALPEQTMFHQTYIWTNQSRNIDELSRMEAAGFKAILLTIDNTGIYGIRTRSLRTTGERPRTGHNAAFDLDSLAAYRNLTPLPVVPKGIKTWQDAKLCLELGFPAIYISNHGGRVLDGAPTAVEIVLDIHKHAPEVFQGMEVYADGGVRRGTDIIKLLALGVRAIGLGRSPMFANVYGQPGVSRLITMLTDEIDTTMALMGAQTADDLRNGEFLNTAAVERKWII